MVTWASVCSQGQHGSEDAVGRLEEAWWLLQGSCKTVQRDRAVPGHRAGLSTVCTIQYC
jgi:hypothetical protein